MMGSVIAIYEYLTFIRMIHYKNQMFFLSKYTIESTTHQANILLFIFICHFSEKKDKTEQGPSGEFLCLVIY